MKQVLRPALRRPLSAGIALVLMALVSPADAAERTVTLAIENMTCASCPYIVRESMEAVPGVSTAKVSFAKKTAVVTFDDAKTTPGAIARASAKNGFPATFVGSGG